MSRKRRSWSPRPAPIVGVEAAQARILRSLSHRTDRFSELLSRAAKTEYQGRVLVASSGLANAEYDEISRLATSAHDEFGHELDGAIANLRDLLTTGDPFFILAVVQDMNLLVPWGEYYEPTHEGSELKIELVAGLLACQSASAPRDRPTSHVMQAILDEIDHIQLVSLLFNLTKSPPGGLDAASLQFSSTMRWMSLRGASFASHAEELALELYRGQDDWMARSFGYTVADLIRVGKAVSGLREARRNELGQAGADAANAALACVEGASELDRQEAAGQAALAVIAVTEAGLRDAATVTTNAICASDPSLDHARVNAILADLSVAVGAVDPTAYRGLFDVNPLRERPFLEHDGTYLLALPGALSRDVDTLMESRVLMARHGFARQRARTLDHLAIAYLSRLLPAAATHPNLHYDGAELDGLVLFERTAIVLEGKASRISTAGQRGDLDRLRADVGGAVEDAWRQGARARDYLLRAGDSVFTNERGGEVLRIPAGQVREVVIVNPTLHELAGLAQQLPRLRSLGLFGAGEYPWSIYINDLRVIAETCENEAIFLHYLTWRNRLPLGERLTTVDEIDLWGAYLFGERFAGLSGGGRMILGNSSTDFDAYYDGLAGRGPRVEPPRKFLPDAIRAFVSKVATARPPGWREAAGVCLDLSIPELAFVEVKMRDLAREAAPGDPVALCAGRVLLVGVSRGTNPSVVLTVFDASENDPTFAVACRLGRSGEPEIAWGQYRKPVTFELSEFEKRAFAAAASSADAFGT